MHLLPPCSVWSKRGENKTSYLPLYFIQAEQSCWWRTEPPPAVPCSLLVKKPFHLLFIPLALLTWAVILLCWDVEHQSLCSLSEAKFLCFMLSKYCTTDLREIFQCARKSLVFFFTLKIIEYKIIRQLSSWHVIMVIANSMPKHLIWEKFCSPKSYNYTT